MTNPLSVPAHRPIKAIYIKLFVALIDQIQKQTMPDIPGLMADGATELAAILDGRDAFIATVSAMVDMGQEINAPAFNMEDFTPASASGRVLARLPRSMHLQLTARAKTEGVSLNSLVLAFIAEGLGRRNAARL